ncbi:MAG: dTDP-4-dehydrorhamnose 3,5-epimerase family protein [Acidimicrobiia bacterium]|nr:dTDP-4-dehydrorhamnose 3,5-epimerase family protein [Acidimicrobiia bacterium]
MTARPTAIPGCSVIDLFHHDDVRGEFVKVFQASALTPAGDASPIAELFWSRSHRGVVRGLHFQTPPHAHTKLVTIVAGTAFDVVVDLRIGSPAYGQAIAVELDAAAPTAVTVPIGCAHGFQATSEGAVVLYAVSTEHSPGADTGIRWDSVRVTWPVPEVVTSDRDAAFAPLAEYASPFEYEPAS